MNRTGAVCAFEDCDRLASGVDHGLCDRHRVQQKKGQTLKPLRVRHDRTDGQADYPCTACGKTKPREAFSLNSVTNQVRSWCRQCNSEKTLERRARKAAAA